MINLLGCAHTEPKIKIVEDKDFCDRYEPLYLSIHQYKLIDELRKGDEKVAGLINSYIHYHYDNEQQYQDCL